MTRPGSESTKGTSVNICYCFFNKMGTHAGTPLALLPNLAMVMMPGAGQPSCKDEATSYKVKPVRALQTSAVASVNASMACFHPSCHRAEVTPLC